MKICPKCGTQFGDDLNFCLTDGSTLKDYNSFNPEDTISSTDNATLEYQSPPTANQNKQTNQSAFGQSPQTARKSNTFAVLAGIFGLIFLLVVTLGGAILYLRYYTARNREWYPTPITNRSFTPYQTPTLQPKENIKVEILEKVKNNEGKQFLKCKITNMGETIVSPFSLTLLFYQGDVKIRENAEFAKIRFLKPGQSIPIWISLYGTENYTAVKVKEPLSTFPLYKPEAQIFPSLTFSETKMERGSYQLTYVRGIVENQNYDQITAKLHIVYYDEKSEIIGFAETRVNLQKGEKAKFEANVSDRDLFGSPKSFEIIAVGD